jgi:hypothetical protein
MQEVTRLEDVRLAGIILPDKTGDALPYLDIKVPKIAEILNEQTADEHRRAYISYQSAENAAPHPPMKLYQISI